MENKERESFSYTYSASQQAEIEHIRKKYLAQEKQEDKMEKLRRLDQGVTKKGMIVSLTIGIIGALLLGIGMSCTMVWADQWFIPGIAVGVIGIVAVSVSYPVYTRITKKERERIAPEIIRLTDELIK